MVQRGQQGRTEVWVSWAGYDPSAGESDGFKSRWQKKCKGGRRRSRMLFMVSSDMRDRVQQMKPSGVSSEQTRTAFPHTADQTVAI